MALPRLEIPTTTVQPSPGTQPTDLTAEQALSGQQAATARSGQEIAGQVQQFAVTVMRDETLKLAQSDAAKVVSFNEKGEPVYNEQDKRWGGLVYNQAFNEAALATYRTAAINDLNKKAELALTRNPADPAAVRAELQPYVDTTLKGMPTHIAERMLPQFSGIVNGAMSSASAGKARLDIKGITDSIPATEQRLTMDRARILASGQDSPASRAAFEKDLDDLDRQRVPAGEPPATIAEKREWIKKSAELHARGIALGYQVASASPGDNMVGRARIEADALAMSAEYSKWSNQTRQILDFYINRGAAQSGAAEAALGYRNSQNVAKLEGDTRTALQDYRYGMTDTATVNSQLRDIEFRRSAMMEGARPTHALAIMTAGRSILEANQEWNTSVSRAAYERLDANTLNSYGAAYTNASTMANKGATQAIRDEGQTQINDLDNDEWLRNKAKTDPRAAQIRAGVTQEISAQAIRGQRYNLTASMQAMSSGKMDPESYPAFVESLRQNNLLDTDGGVTTSQLIAAQETGRKAHKERQQTRDAAATVQENYTRTGVPPNASGRAARETVLKATGASTQSTTDELGNTIPIPARIDKAGVEYAKSFMYREGFYPDDFLKELTAVTTKLDVPKEQQEAALNMVRAYQDNLRKTLAKNYPNNAKGLEAAVQSYSLEQFGEKTLSAARAYEIGYGEAKPEAIQKELEKKGARGVNASDFSPAAIVAAFGGTNKLVAVWQDATENPGQSFWQSGSRWLLSLGGVLGKDVVGGFNPFRLEHLRTVFAGKAPAGLTLENMEYAPDAAMDLLNFTMDYVKKRGQVDLDQNMDPYEQAAVQWGVEKRDRISFERGTDANGLARYTVRMDGFYDEANKSNSVTWGKKYWNTFIASRMVALYPDKAAMVDPSTYTVTSERMATGRMIYTISAMSKNGQTPIEFTDVRPDDPVWRTELDRVDVAVAKQMQQREARSLVDKYWTLQFFRGEEASKLRDQFVRDSMSGKDAGETWVRFAQGMRKLIGPESSISEEALDKWGRPEIGRVLREQGLIDFVINGPGVSRAGVFEQRGRGIGEEIQYGIKPAADPGLVDPSQSFDLEQERNAAEARRRMEAPPQARQLPGSRSEVPGTVTGGVQFDRDAPRADPRPPHLRTPEPPPVPESGPFKPESGGYDYERAKASGMKPETSGPNKGHWGSVAETNQAERRKYGLPRESYIVLKGRSHETFNLAQQGEEERGFEIRKFGDRYYSVPKNWKPDKGTR